MFCVVKIVLAVGSGGWFSGILLYEADVSIHGEMGCPYKESLGLYKESGGLYGERSGLYGEMKVGLMGMSCL